MKQFIFLFILQIGLFTIYGQETDSINDLRDGQIYKIIKIGQQWWMKENLNYYVNNSWYYNNDSLTYSKTYGRLYNWETAKNVCPSGFHLPDDHEWNILQLYLGMNPFDTDLICNLDNVIAGKLKETGTEHWGFPNKGATDEVGFKALPSGYRHYSVGNFKYLGNYACFWTASQKDSANAWYRHLYSDTAGICRTFNSKDYGFSVRCMKSECDNIILIDSICDVVCNGDSSGEIYITIEGGVPPYSYL